MPDPELERFETGSRGVRDAAALLPIFAIALLIPPIILIFAKPVTIGGIPLIVIYLFAVWAALIGAAFLFAQRLGKPEKPQPDDDKGS